MWTGLSGEEEIDGTRGRVHVMKIALARGAACGLGWPPHLNEITKVHSAVHAFALGALLISGNSTREHAAVLYEMHINPVQL